MHHVEFPLRSRERIVFSAELTLSESVCAAVILGCGPGTIVPHLQLTYPLRIMSGGPSDSKPTSCLDSGLCLAFRGTGFFCFFGLFACFEWLSCSPNYKHRARLFYDCCGLCGRPPQPRIEIPIDDEEPIETVVERYDYLRVSRTTTGAQRQRLQ